MNQVMLTGYLAKEVELKQYVKDNKQRVYAFGTIIAKDLDGQPDQFIEFVVFEQQANFIHKYLKKGSQIEIIGKLSVKSGKNENGEYVKDYKVIVGKVRCLDRKGTQYNQQQAIIDNNNFANQNEVKYQKPQQPVEKANDPFDIDAQFNISADDLPF